MSFHQFYLLVIGTTLLIAEAFVQGYKPILLGSWRVKLIIPESCSVLTVCTALYIFRPLSDGLRRKAVFLTLLWTKGTLVFDKNSIRNRPFFERYTS